jgi:hypothetical protein
LPVHDFTAFLRFSHHTSVSCSAHPGFNAIIFISSEGEKAEARHLPVSPSITEAFTEELPKSIPNKSILIEFIILFEALNNRKYSTLSHPPLNPPGGTYSNHIRFQAPLGGLGVEKNFFLCSLAAQRSNIQNMDKYI